MQGAVPRRLHPVEGPGVPAVGDAVVVGRVDVVGGQHVEGEAVRIRHYLVLVRSDVALVDIYCFSIHFSFFFYEAQVFLR